MVSFLLELRGERPDLRAPPDATPTDPDPVEPSLDHDR